MKNLSSFLDRTSEQIDILQAADRIDGTPIIINAGSGTGKTSILVDIARQAKRKGLKVVVIVFNKHNAVECDSAFRGLAEVRTLNSLAYSNTATNKRKIGNLYIRQVINLLSLENYSYNISASNLAKSVIATINVFCNSSDASVTASHAIHALYGNTRNIELIEALVMFAERLFNLITAKNSVIPIPHNVYLKNWQLLGAPGIETYDLVLVDEGQDSNSLAIAVYKLARGLIIVGDDNQSLYGFRSAESALTSIKGFHYSLSQSFRFGQEVANLANKIASLKVGGNKGVEIKGLDVLNTEIGIIPKGLKHTRIFRANNDLVFCARFFDDQNLPISIDGDMSELASRLDSAWKLKSGYKGKIENRLVAGFKSWDEIEETSLNHSGSEISQIYEIVKEHDKRTPDVVEILSRNHDKERAKIRLVNAYKCKGLEFNEVMIHDDFDTAVERSRNKSSWNEEMNILYVSVTRAMRTLDIRSDFLKSLM